MGNMFPGLKLFAANGEPLKNPGATEDVHKEFQRILPVHFQGGRIIINKRIGSHWHLSHTFRAPSPKPSGYQFEAIYSGPKPMSPEESFPLRKDNIDSGGCAGGVFTHYLTPEVRCRVASLIKSQEIIRAVLTADYMGQDYTASFSFGYPNILKSSYILLGQYLQAVNENLSLGLEVEYEPKSKFNEAHILYMSGGFRYVNGRDIWSAACGIDGGGQFCFYRKTSDQFQFGIQLRPNFEKRYVVGTIGCQVDLPQSDFVFRGMVNSDLVAAAVLERKLQPLPFTLLLSGHFNGTTKNFTLGFGLTSN